ncbi:hypothetical protein [Variovorax sp.]|uniref:hypothetical protein n=1 Tax=Variovorax sp. TaxID=1871043 RepID=UPI003BAD4FFC
MDIPPPLPGAESAPDDPVSNGEFIRLATRRDAKRDWTRRFSDEYQRLHQGRVDIEYLTLEAHAVYPFLSHRPPEECARQRFGFDTGADRFEVQAEQKFRTLAGNIGLIDHGQPLPEDLKEFAHGVAELCAASAEQYRHPRDGSAGDHIRATFCAQPF